MLTKQNLIDAGFKLKDNGINGYVYSKTIDGVIILIQSHPTIGKFYCTYISNEINPQSGKNLLKEEDIDSFDDIAGIVSKSIKIE